MARIPVLLAVALSLAACGGPSRVSDATVSTQGSGEVAKALFGAVPGPSAQSPEPVGSYARGCQAGAVQLAETGPTWQAMRLSRNRNWAQPGTVAFVEDLSRFAATLPGWDGLYVGDMSQPRGGPMTSGHASHQTGLDVDLWLRPADRLTLTGEEREDVSSTDMQWRQGAAVNDAWSPQHEALVRAAASDPRVARIFIFAGAKVEMCANAGADRDWLRKVRPWWGHNTHFHVRLACPAGASACEDQAPVPAGDGCAEAQEWVDGILNAAPPDPDAPDPEPRRDLTMADLPAQCSAVLGAG